MIRRYLKKKKNCYTYIHNNTKLSYTLTYNVISQRAVPTVKQPSCVTNAIVIIVIEYNITSCYIVHTYGTEVNFVLVTRIYIY